MEFFFLSTMQIEKYCTRKEWESVEGIIEVINKISGFNFLNHMFCQAEEALILYMLINLQKMVVFIFIVILIIRWLLNLKLCISKILKKNIIGVILFLN